MISRFFGSRSSFRRVLAFSSLCVFASQAARAGAYTWQGGGANNNWSTAANWVGNAAPPSDLVNTDLVFGTSDAIFPSIDSAYSIRSLTWNAGASGYFFDSGPLTLGAGGFTQNAANAQTFGAPVILGADQTWNLAAGAGALTLNGGVNTGGGANRALTINAATTTGSGNVINGNFTGGGSLTKTGAGILTLGGTASTYSGGTTISAGTLAFSNAGALGTGTVTLSGGELRATADVTLNNSVSVSIGSAGAFSAAPNTTLTLNSFIVAAGNLTVGAAGQTGAVTLGSVGGNGASSSATLVVNAGTLRAGASIALDSFTSAFASTTVNTGATLDLNGFNTTVNNLQGAGAITTGGTSSTVLTVNAGSFFGAVSGSGALTKNGTGTLTLTGASTYTGATTVNAGALAVGSGGSVTGGNVTVNAGGALAISGAGSVSPGSGKTITVDGTSASPASLTLAGNGTLSTGSAYVGNNGVGRVIQSGGTFIVSTLTPNSGSQLLLGNNAGSSGAYTLTGGSLSTHFAFVGNSGVGSVTQSGGTFTANGALYLSNNPGSSGAYTLTGGSLSIFNAFLGDDGVGSVTQSGGTFTASGNLYVGYNSGGDGAYSLSGVGSLTTGSTILSGLTGRFMQNGGTHTTGTLTLSDYFPEANVVYQLDGGTLAANNVRRTAGAGTFNFNGGTLQARQNNTAFFQGLSTANVRGGGAVIDAAGFNVTVAQPLLHSTIAGDASTDGGLTKNGAGTLTLSGVNTFTGPLAINAGTLAVANENALGAPTGGVTTVNGGGQLLFTGSATLGCTYNLGVSTLAVGSGNTLTFNGASLNGGFLAGPGADALGNGATLGGVTTLASSTLTQGAGSTATLNTTTIRGALTQTGGTLALNNASVSPAGRVSVGGTVNTNGTESLGVITVNNGGTLANSGSSLYLGGGSRTAVNTGGTLSATGGSTIELNGGLLTNNGAQTGALNVNFGGVAKGSGTFGTVSVGDGGRFGANTSSAGASANGLASFRLKGAEGIGRAAFVGPVLNTMPGTVNVGSLTLNSGSLLAVNVQDAQGIAGGGYDTARVQGALTLNGYRTPGDQITIGLSSLGSNGAAGAAANFDPSQSYVLTLVTANEGITGFDAASFQVDASSFQNSLSGGHFFVAQDGNNLNLDFTPVPEPATWAGGALLLVGAAGTIRQRARRGL